MTLQHAYTLLVHWKQDAKNMVHLIGGKHDGIAFAMVGSDEHRQPRTKMDLRVSSTKKKVAWRGIS
jgi:hypothetical protein